MDLLEQIDEKIRSFPPLGEAQSCGSSTNFKYTDELAFWTDVSRLNALLEVRERYIKWKDQKNREEEMFKLDAYG